MSAKNLAKDLLQKNIWPYIRKKIIIRKHYKITQQIQYLINDCNAGKLEEFKIQKKKQIPSSKGIIWQYWAQGYEESNLPPLIKLCLNSVSKYASEFTIIRLSDDNITQYIDIPQWLLDKKKQISLAHYADIIRCILLSIYGGIWLDAAIYLTGKLPNYIFEKDFFMYQRDSNETNKKYWENTFAYYFGWDKGFKVNVLIGIIYSKPNSKVITDMCQMLMNFWSKHNTIPDYFFFQILFDIYIKSHPERNCKIVSDCPPHLLRQLINELPLINNIETIKKITTIHSLNYKNPKAADRLQNILDKSQI